MCQPLHFAAGLAAARLVMLMKRGKGIVDGSLFPAYGTASDCGGIFLLMIFRDQRNAGRFTCPLELSVVFTWRSVIAAGGRILPHNAQDRRGAVEQLMKM